MVWLASQRVTASSEPFGVEEKTKSKDANHSYNSSFSKATRKESVSEMDNNIKAAFIFIEPPSEFVLRYIVFAATFEVCKQPNPRNVPAS